MNRLVILLLAFLLPVPFAGAKTKHSRSTHHSKRPACVHTARPKPMPFSTVIIDAGHGGHDCGGIRQNIIPEKGVALDVALRLNSKLKEAGFQTVLTRRNDTFIPLDSRVAIGNAHPGAVFVSIHFDACPRRAPSGIDVHYGSLDSAPLAAQIEKRLIAKTHAADRGIKKARFCVLRKTKIRAVLVECGFLTNPREAALIRRASYRQILADQICAGIVAYRKTL